MAHLLTDTSSSSPEIEPQIDEPSQILMFGLATLLPLSGLDQSTRNWGSMG